MLPNLLIPNGSLSSCWIRSIPGEVVHTDYVSSLKKQRVCVISGIVEGIDLRLFWGRQGREGDKQTSYFYLEGGVLGNERNYVSRLSKWNVWVILVAIDGDPAKIFGVWEGEKTSRIHVSCIERGVVGAEKCVSSISLNVLHYYQR